MAIIDSHCPHHNQRLPSGTRGGRDMSAEKYPKKKRVTKGDQKAKRRYNRYRKGGRKGTPNRKGS